MKYSINISSAVLLYLTVEAETELFEARRSIWNNMIRTSTRGRGASCGRTFSADRSEAETEPFEARRASSQDHQLSWWLVLPL